MPAPTRKRSNSEEITILWCSVGMGLALLMLCAYLFMVDPPVARALGLAFVAHTVGGRAAGIGLCIMNGFGPWITIAYNFYLEVLIVAFTYAVFILSINNYIKLRWVRLQAIRLERKARAHKEGIARYGWIGLFLFVMAPLPVTGPVVGSIIGALLQFRLLKNFSATFLGTLAAIIVWTLFFDFLEAHMHAIQYILAAIVAIILLCYARTIKSWFSS